MPSSKIQARSSCPVSFALDRFGDKWSLIIVRDLMFRGRHTYGELLDASEGIATNILADRLQRLESEGIINKTRDPENRRRYIYQLTQKGMALAPILLEMIRWSGKHDPDTGVPKKFLRQLNKDPEALLKQIQSGSFKM